MAITKYFSKNTNGEFLFASQTEDNWTLFKQNYESAHPNERLILLSGNVFPNGFNLAYDGVKYTTRDNTPLSVSNARDSLIKQIASNTDLLRFSGSVTYDGKQFSKAQLNQIYASLLDLLTTELPPETYPLPVATIVAGDYLLLNNATEVHNFAHAILNEYIAFTKQGYSVVQTVKALSTIESIINFVDSRI